MSFYWIGPQDKDQTTRHTNVAFEVVRSARETIQRDESSNDLKFFRMTTKRLEYLVTLDGQFILVVLHKSSSSDLHSNEQKSLKRAFW